MVLTDAITALEVPAWGPKVIAWHYAMPYVDDRDARRSVVHTYFEAGTSEAERHEILDAWCAEWILIVPERLDGSAGADVSELAMGGSPVAHGRAVLVPAPAQGSCDGAGAR